MPSVLSKSFGHPLRNLNLEEFHEQMLVNCYGIDPTTGKPINPKTTNVQSAFDSAKNLLEAANRLDDVTNVLHGALSDLSDKHSSKKKVKAAKQLIEKTIIPAIDAASDVARTRAKRSAPIGGAGYGHARA